jgi:iron complex transport system ATP-binding protein
LPGRVTGIVGPNGAGKSTLLGALAGLLPTTSGRVELDGRDVATLAPAERARAIAFLPQNRTVHWPMSARSIVALGRLPHQAAARGATGETEAAAVSHALAVMDLAALADRPVDRLSGGELARVLVARALAQESAILLADEPTAGLDPVHALVLLEHFRRLATGGRAIAIVLHDMTLAARFCDDVVLIDAGRIAAAGPAAEVLTPARLEPVLGVGIATGTVGGVPVVVATAPRT